MARGTSPARQAEQQISPFVVFLDLRAVGSRTHVETFGPRLRDDLDEVVVSLEVLGQQDQVVAALVGLALLVCRSRRRAIDLAADDGLEGEFPPAAPRAVFRIWRSRQRGRLSLLRTVAQGGDAASARGSLLLQLALDLLDVVVELLDAEHVAVVRDGNAGLSVGHGLVHQTLDAGLAVENRILRVNVKVNELGHGCLR